MRPNEMTRFAVSPGAGLLRPAAQRPSPNQDERPGGAEPELVAHIISFTMEGDREITGQDFVIAKGDAAQSDTGSTAVGYQNEAVDADAATEDDEAEGGKRRRNRRRKRKSRDEDRDAEVAAENAETSEAASDDNADEVAEKDDGKRKRGKRNGRKSKSGDQAETDNEASDASADASTRSETTGAEDVSEVQTAASDAEPERPKRRSILFDGIVWVFARSRLGSLVGHTTTTTTIGGSLGRGRLGRWLGGDESPATRGMP